MKISQLAISFFLFFILTMVTQTGGVIWIVSLILYKCFLKKDGRSCFVRRGLLVSLFTALYMLSTFFLIPPLARLLGRVPLPLYNTGGLKPHTLLTCLLNRHYVRPEMKEISLAVAQHLTKTYPGTHLNYLDANFPFLNNFPLFPHLSHHDGKKLDLAFCYQHSRTKVPTHQVPSFIGYGICEEPLPGEINMPEECAHKGYWQYSLLKKIIPQSGGKDYRIDPARTKMLLDLYTAQQGIGKIFIEPHLVSRLNLNKEKIRFHGCQAVRHDDHIHVQLK